MLINEKLSEGIPHYSSWYLDVSIPFIMVKQLNRYDCFLDWKLNFKFIVIEKIFKE